MDGTRFRYERRVSPIQPLQPWRKWRDCTESWEKAAMSESRSVATIKAFKNSELGEAWVEEAKPLTGSACWSAVRITASALCLRAACAARGGADAEGSHRGLHLGLRRGKESWFVEHRVLMGDTARDEVWRQLGAVLGEQWGRTKQAR